MIFAQFVTVLGKERRYNSTSYVGCTSLLNTQKSAVIRLQFTGAFLKIEPLIRFTTGTLYGT